MFVEDLHSASREDQHWPRRPSRGEPEQWRGNENNFGSLMVVADEFLLRMDAG
jgi:hypothetical protein